MSALWKSLKMALVLGLFAGLSGCSDPQVYGSVGISNGYGGYGNYGRYGSPRVRTSISVGGRIR